MATDLTVIGLGYVGLPLALEACRADLAVVGYDTSLKVVESLNAGRSHVDDVTDEEVASMRTQGFTATNSEAELVGTDVFVICVPTPLSSDGVPDLSAVVDVSNRLSGALRPGCLVVLESTTYPGTTEGTVRPLLERGSGLTAGIDFSLAYSPERIDPGNSYYGIRNTPKIVGGLTPACTEKAVEFYGQIVDEVVVTVGLAEAELAKLLENTYRHVNIALVNEMSIFCHELGVDLWSAIDAAKTKPFGFEAFYPGPGVGGHCIPIDPNYLSWIVRSIGYRFRIVELTQEISTRMPTYIVRRVQDALNVNGKPVKGSNILLLGVTYKADIGDIRETPATPIASQLLSMGAEVRYFDPYVDEFVVDGCRLSGESDLAKAMACTDMAVLVQAHRQIVDSDALALAPQIFDTRGVLEGDNVERL
ncbi:MAG: nucleotide sugar dehydrogenase [SAR202 cluster bacterium]|jgi:UDP-N-acetyl-D-glucosamine dehydrogenase|nr:nucleotide sugar dehydrogenase [SAR202 cluster bacterium]